MTALWIVLYWPICSAIVYLGSRLERRYPPGSVKRGRAEQALRYLVIVLPAAPVVVGAAWLMADDPSDSSVLFAEALIAFNLSLLLVLGGLRLLAMFRRR